MLGVEYIDSTFRNKLLLRIHKTTVLENLCIAQENIQTQTDKHWNEEEIE